MSTHRPPSCEISDPEQWKACSTPIRLEILDSLRAHSPCTIRDIARDIERPAPTLYKHIEAMEKAGFVVRSGYRKSGRHVEQIIDLAADNFRVAFKTGDSAETDALVDTARSFTHAGYTAFRDAAEAGALRITPDDLNTLVAYGLGRLTPEGFKKIRALLGEMRDTLSTGRTERSGDLYAVSIVVTPLCRKKTKRGRKPRAGTGDKSAT